MDGDHTIEPCENVTGTVLDAVFNALREQRVWLEGMLLKPNMIVSGKACVSLASVPEVAAATLRCLLCHVPAVVPGIVFLSGGQSDVVATEHLNAISAIPGNKPWRISFSYGRARQDQALAAWRGNNANSRTAQQAYYHRAKCNSAASLGKYATALENDSTGEIAKGHRSQHEDD
jgi:fructose-bisphosphate aldolase class I